MAKPTTDGPEASPPRERTVTLHLDAALVEPLLSWKGVMDAIAHGHTLPRAEIDDTLLRRRHDALLSRAALIDGLGSLVKTATVFPGNPEVGVPAVNGAASLFSDSTGLVDATIDFHLLTKWKTAADSALAASRLASPATREILIIGSGTVAASMIDAYRAVFPDAAVSIWSRTHTHAARLAEARRAVAVVDLAEAVNVADVICTATMSTQPVLRGRWLRSGQHVDLIGGYRADMRETDNAAIGSATVFVDSLTSALDVGDIVGPIDDNIISVGQIVDFTGLANGSFTRSSDDQITICKNAGGAHLDLMVARHMHQLVASTS